MRIVTAWMSERHCNNSEVHARNGRRDMTPNVQPSLHPLHAVTLRVAKNSRFWLWPWHCALRLDAVKHSLCSSPIGSPWQKGGPKFGVGASPRQMLVNMCVPRGCKCVYLGLNKGVG